MTASRPLRALLLAAGFAATAASVHAADWRIDPQASAIQFRSTQFGQPFTGEFKRFSGRIVFTPGPSPTGDVKIDVDVASLKTGAADRDAQAQGPAWFATAKAPQAVFTATRFRRIDAQHYAAFGTLAIKGIQVQVTLPFTLHVGVDGVAEMQGAASVNRLAFGLGTGPLADPATVGRQVAVEVRLRATPEGQP